MRQKGPRSFNDIRPFFQPITTNQHAAIKDLKKTRDQWLDSFYRIVSKKNIKLILLCGTCLGVVRDNEIISYDTDADYGIYIEDLEALWSCVDELLKEGIYISGRGKYQISFSLPNINFYIDIWPIKKESLFMRVLGWHWHADHMSYRKKYFDNLQAVQFQNKTYYLPNPPEEYLEQVYGSDWRIPIKGRFSGVRGLLSQCINALFVDFPVPSQFSGDNSLGTYKPWVSQILKRWFPNLQITSLFKHPN